MTPGNVALGRITAGAVFLVFPRVLLRAWAGTTDRHLVPLARAIGGRDVALGLGALVALRNGDSANPWLRAAALSDAVDALATLVAFRHLPRARRWLVIAAAITGASTCELAIRRRESLAAT